jgi:hypothetical protein
MRRTSKSSWPINGRNGVGYTTSDWLKGDPLRRRSHYPNPAKISVFSSDDDEWSKSNDVVGEIEAQRFGGDYLTFYLTRQEAGEVVSALFDHAAIDVQQNAAASLLARFSDSDLLRFMGELIQSRANEKEGATQSG